VRELGGVEKALRLVWGGGGGGVLKGNRLSLGVGADRTSISS